jgi:hypothetical protein
LQDLFVLNVAAAFKKAGLDTRLIEILPSNKRTFETLKEHLSTYDGLQEIITWQTGLRSAGNKKMLQRYVTQRLMTKDKSDLELAIHVHKEATTHGLTHADLIPLLWSAVVDSVEWNKKVDLLAEQAYRQINSHSHLLRFFAQTLKTQVLLMNRVQSYLYEKQTLLSSFSKIIFLLYQNKVLSEQAINDWYNYSHSLKAKSVVFAQMKPMVDWLATAQENDE